MVTLNRSTRAKWRAPKLARFNRLRAMGYRARTAALLADLEG